MSHSQSGFAEINGARLYYDVSGSGHPLLLLHAGVADSRMWDDQVSAFRAHYQVIRFDLRGFGQSNMPAGRFCNHEDVRELLSFLNVEKAHLLGISFGGLIALDFTLAYPEMVEALILAAPSISGDTPSARIRQFWQEEDELIEQGELEAATELNLRLWVDGLQRSPEEVEPAVRQRVAEMQLNALKVPIPDDIEQESLTPPAIGRLSEVQAPTLIIIGDLDLEEKLIQADKLMPELPHARKEVISNTAHLMNMEKPAEFNQLVLDFLRT